MDKDKLNQKNSSAEQNFKSSELLNQDISQALEILQMLFIVGTTRLQY